MDYLGKRQLEEYKTTFKNKGVMAPEKIERYNSELEEELEYHPKINICLKKEKDGGFTVLI